MSTNRRDQQQTERLHIEEFLRRRGVEAAVEYGDAPDAVLLIEGSRVGLEHRELVEEDLAANRPNIEWLERALKDELTKLGLGEDFSVAVGVEAHAAYFRKRSNVDVLVLELARFARGQAVNVGPGATLEFCIPELESQGFPILRALSVSRVMDLRGGPHVAVSPGFWGRSSQSVLLAIRKKERQLAKYKRTKALDASWLLLVTGELWTQVTDSATANEWPRFRSSFDAVFLMELGGAAGTRVRALRPPRTSPRRGVRQSDVVPGSAVHVRRPGPALGGGPTPRRSAHGAGSFHDTPCTTLEIVLRLTPYSFARAICESPRATAARMSRT